MNCPVLHVLLSATSEVILLLRVTLVSRVFFFLFTPINNAPWKTKNGQTPNLICICELARGCRANVGSSHIKDLT